MQLVPIGGFFEILGGIGILVPPVSQAAAWGLLLLFIAVFPANINMAMNEGDRVEAAALTEHRTCLACF